MQKKDLNTVLGRNLFCIANDCSANLSDLSKMLLKKQMKYFDAWKVPVLQELLNTMQEHIIYINIAYLFIILHIFLISFVYSNYFNKFKLLHL